MSDTSARVIRLRGVRVHNLQGIDVDLPLGRLIALTGVSGSGKSSLAIDTLLAEGQRRYAETLSPYTRQFLQTLDKPRADRIDGIPPALLVGNRGARRSLRSTVGTITEVHEHLALLFAREGRVHCRHCGAEVVPASADRIVEAIDGLPEGARYQIGFPVDLRPDSDGPAIAAALREAGFVRAVLDGRTISLDDELPPLRPGGVLDGVVDRLIRGRDDRSRTIESIETAFARGLGRCVLLVDDQRTLFHRGWRCGRCGTDAVAPEPRLFRYNSPVGACPACEGTGGILDLDLARIVPDPGRSLAEGAIAPWNTPKHRPRLEAWLAAAAGLGLRAEIPFAELSPWERALLMEGSPGLVGLREFFRRLERKAYRLPVRVFLARWRGYRTCPDCDGRRLNPDALAVKLDGRDIAALSACPIDEARACLGPLESSLGPAGRAALRPILRRLDVLTSLGLGYLSLDRPARSLSGGESRRVALTAALGSGLVNALYVLDEPSAGLHPADVQRLVGSIHALRDAGNTVVMVEHDATLIRAADRAVDLGPGAGEHGGRIVCEAPPESLPDCPESLTGAYLGGRASRQPPEKRRPVDRGRLTLRGASGHNLQKIDVGFPLGVLCVVSGVSGSGKSTLIEQTLYPALARLLRREPLPAAPFDSLEGAEELGDVVLIDQQPIGRTPRSNPVTYLGAFDEIRKTFAATHEARTRGYPPSRFSFNVEGGRCPACEGNGYQTIDMQFLPDVLVRCSECRGRRYRPEVLEVTYRGKSIAEVLDLTAREAFGFFRNRPRLQMRLRPLNDVGLGYLRLGQPASTLSGGEAQRLKLASLLASSAAAITRSASGPRTLFLLDEPTTGLHPADVSVLLDALDRLIDLGHSVVVVEHNLDVMAAADWIIDLGPEAGASGGRVVAAGTPEQVALSAGHTATALADHLRR